MLEIIILMFLFGGVETAEGFHADVDLPAGFFFQPVNTAFRNLLFFLRQIVDRQSVGMAPVNELPVGIKGVHTLQENLEKLREADLFPR